LYCKLFQDLSVVQVNLIGFAIVSWVSFLVLPWCYLKECRWYLNYWLHEFRDTSLIFIVVWVWVTLIFAINAFFLGDCVICQNHLIWLIFIHLPAFVSELIFRHLSNFLVAHLWLFNCLFNYLFNCFDLCFPSFPYLFWIYLQLVLMHFLINWFIHWVFF
jgi:hypothetical protein